MSRKVGIIFSGQDDTASRTAGYICLVCDKGTTGRAITLTKTVACIGWLGEANGIQEGCGPKRRSDEMLIGCEGADWLWHTDYSVGINRMRRVNWNPKLTSS